MKKIEMMIECPSCKGTGVYSGMGENKDTAVICYKCKGTGEFEYVYQYEEFTEEKLQVELKECICKDMDIK